MNPSDFMDAVPGVSPEIQGHEINALQFEGLVWQALLPCSAKSLVKSNS
jgi:hypothetical protein